MIYCMQLYDVLFLLDIFVGFVLLFYVIFFVYYFWEQHTKSVDLRYERNLSWRDRANRNVLTNIFVGLFVVFVFLTGFLLFGK